MTKQLALINGGVTLVDDDVFEWASQHRWRRDAHGYVSRQFGSRGEKRTTEFLHRRIMQPPGDPNVVVDHINHDPLDNQRSNLRVIDRGRNQENRSGAQANTQTGVRGVFWSTQKGAYQVKVQRYGKHHHGGYFARLDDASVAAAALRQRLFTYTTEASQPVIRPPRKPVVYCANCGAEIARFKRSLTAHYCAKSDCARAYHRTYRRVYGHPERRKRRD